MSAVAARVAAETMRDDTTSFQYTADLTKRRFDVENMFENRRLADIFELPIGMMVGAWLHR